MSRPRAVLKVDPLDQLSPTEADTARFITKPKERAPRSYREMPIKRATSAHQPNPAAKRQRRQLIIETYQHVYQGSDAAYTGEPHDNMLRSMRLAGCTREQIAAALAIKVPTLDMWLQQHPSFKVAWLEGGDLADGMVAHRLFKRAMGFTKKAKKIFCNKDGEVTEVEYDEYYPPDVGACNIWLTNRQTRLWKNRRANEMTGPDGEELPTPHFTIIPVTTNKDFALAQAAAIAAKEQPPEQS